MNPITVDAMLIILAAIVGATLFYLIIHKPRIRKLQRLSQDWLMEAMAPDAQNEVKYLMQIQTFYLQQLRGQPHAFSVKAKKYLRTILSKDITRVHNLYREYYTYSQPPGLTNIITSIFAEFKKEIQKLLVEEFYEAIRTKKESDFMKKIKSPLFEYCEIVNYFPLEIEKVKP